MAGCVTPAVRRSYKLFSTRVTRPVGFFFDTREAEAFSLAQEIPSASISSDRSPKRPLSPAGRVLVAVVPIDTTLDLIATT